MRLPLVAAAVLMLAGCASPQGDPVDSSATANATASEGAVAMNDDGSSASQVADTAHMPHLHDYWDGKERVTLFDGEVDPDAVNLTFATLVQVFFFHQAAVGGTQFFLPEGKIVYEGTGVVEVTATWSDPRVTGIGFVYSSADNSDLKEGGSLKSGTPFPIPITPQQTDTPHAKSSRWWFGFGADGNGAVAGPFNLKIDIVKVNDVMLFPAHPDFWQGASEVTLIDADHHGEVESYPKRSLQPLTQGGFTEDWVNFTHVVPMEAQAIRVVATITSATSTPGEVASFGFFYHGADTRAPFRCPIKPLEGALPQTLEWIVPSTMEMSDSPYSPASTWQFLVEPIVVLADGAPQMGGMTDVSYDYHVVGTALIDAPESLDSCSRDEF